ncbi:MAG: GNAT family N-acetyltransferase [bacterium]|nr:GNAT family N-acetyltransferase [bacterium]
MDTIVKLTDIKDFYRVFDIMEQSFPPDERRPKAEQLALLNNPAHSIYILQTDGDTAAFITVWQFDSFAFIEHFAVHPDRRCGGTGSFMLSKIIPHLGVRVCLEAEPPLTEIAERRIGFYERNGFTLNKYPYIQPPISKGKAPVPLMIMTTGGGISESEFDKIRDVIYREVYKYAM